MNTELGKRLYENLNKLDHGIIADKYLALCRQWDKCPELAENEKFKQLFEVKKHLLFDDPDVHDIIKDFREENHALKKNFWWYIDKL